MSQKQRLVKLSEHWQDGERKCFKKTIGGQRFYLSIDLAESERMAMALLSAWAQIRAGGHTQWNDDAINDALHLAGVPSNRKCSVRPKISGKLYAAIETYLADYQGRVSESRHRRQTIALNTYKRFQKDCLLVNVTWDKLNAAVNYYRSRPKIATGLPMAVATVQTTIKAIRAMFDWLDMSERWEAPRRFDRVFRVSYQSLKTATELKREGDGHEVFTVEELVVLWRNATPRQRTWLGMALATGETAQGLASLLKTQILRQQDSVVIDRNRHKTGVRGIYPLWPEVAELVLAQMDTDASEPLAFKTMDGKPLVWFHTTGRVDSVAKTWANLLVKSEGVRAFGFATLRKTGASMIEQLTGNLETAQLYLSHKGKSVAEKHYLAKHFDKLADGLISMRHHLNPMFDCKHSVFDESVSPPKRSSIPSQCLGITDEHVAVSRSKLVDEANGDEN